MPVSEKEIIERLPDWIAEKKTSFLFGSGTSAPGMPLMNMFPGKKDGSTDVDGLMYEIIKRNKFLIGAKMKINVSEEESKAILGTLGAYKKFIEILLDMLGNVNARERHKNINIFTTNYDLFIEKAVDDIYESGSTAPFIFNDGARGYFNRLLDNSNFDTTTAYKGRFDNYINELPSINLAKIHGSVNWKKQSEDMIRVCNYVVRDKPEKRETVKPDGNEPKATTLKKHYYEMLRFFEYEMSESAENIGNGSLLIVHGFSFGDKHIVHALKRALENRELLVIIVAYTDNDVEVIKRNLKDLAERKNLRFLCPKDFSFHGEEFSRLDLNNFIRKNVDTECKETFALLLSKMLYENKKNDSNCASVHLIIDEAHNILNSFKSTHSDVWEDYRLTTFETMIKEGRKYGFFLTIASQRPADISPTIMSQIHNYIIHKLVNDKDLQMLENTMPTLDAFSKSRIPTLGKGEAVLTGRAFGMPSLIKVDYEEYSRPDSDDVDLIAAWSENPEASK